VPLPPPVQDPERVADLLGSRADLPGERKHVSVLFADVTASMAVLTSHDAEEAAALFDQVVEYMVEAVRRWEGTVTQVLGDGIMALFGAPLAHEDHAVRACYAALRMQQRITAYGDDVQRAHGIPILIRVGLNSGEVVLRPLGSDPSALSAVGQTVHLASRLEQLAKLPCRHRIYTHINNSNPVLLERSPEREAVVRAGLIVGYDGLYITL
jgi:class 3 adenylate cyclase